MGIIFYIIYAFYRVNSAVDTEGPPTADIDREYLALFKTHFYKNFSNFISSRSKIRNTQTAFDFDKKYAIVVEKLNLESNSSVDYFVKVKREEVGESINTIYGSFEKNSFYYKRPPEVPKGREAIFFYYCCDSLKIITRNDSLINFYTERNDFGIKYSKEGPFDILFDRKYDKVPVHFIFLKREKKFFLIIMVPYSRESMKPQQLLNILNG